ncbi:hypothetical protein KM295_13185 [Natronomonas sp. F2-12]|jgi:hypothetical protein|uniref:Cell division protein A N-terminal domain-containing protein n=1 Tax=Natronomonas aquatica TaxID=2841590 RepID=A0A9R1CUY0_9EURY|nr:hypothetical protein [Natronomonas aquatica]MCQ4334412.1 hypothetical protein [Natronomonas aquatica]
MAPSDTADDRLIELYRSYIGEPDRRTDVYLGFALFFGGLGLGLLGLVLFVLERAFLDGIVFFVRQIAFAIGAIGLPLLLVAVVVLLPADKRALYVAAGGLAIVLAAIGFFVSVYPSNWNYGTPDYSLHGVTVYAVGLISVLAATASALVGYHIERVEGGPGAEAADDGSDDGDDTAVTDEQIRRDIDEAMADTEISWGGVERVETERLHITPDEELEGQSLDQSSTNVHRSSSIDDQLSALKGLKGGEQRTDSGSGVDDQAAALKELREQKREEEAAKPTSLLERIKAYLGL